jgi:hypothetical protein
MFLYQMNLFLDMCTKLWKAPISFVKSDCLSVHPFVSLSTWNNSAPTGRIFMKFNFWVFFKTLSRKFKFTGTLHEDVCKFMTSRWILLRMKNVSDKSCTVTQNTILYSITFSWKSNHLWDNVEKWQHDNITT